MISEKVHPFEDWPAAPNKALVVMLHGLAVVLCTEAENWAIDLLDGKSDEPFAVSEGTEADQITADGVWVVDVKVGEYTSYGGVYDSWPILANPRPPTREEWAAYLAGEYIWYTKEQVAAIRVIEAQEAPGSCAVGGET